MSSPASKTVTELLVQLEDQLLVEAFVKLLQRFNFASIDFINTLAAFLLQYLFAVLLFIHIMLVPRIC
jgi:hypothetical protein